jgi:dTMP kinase
MMDIPAGKFISLEGIEGVGKTTHLHFIVNYLHTQNRPVLATREPGGTLLADEIRHFLLADHGEIICPDSELLLMFAARAQHIARVIKPALEGHKWVICDRFTDASYAYQGAGRGLGAEKIALLENLVQGNLRPDLTILFDAPLNIAFERMKQRGKIDRFESENILFFERVQNAYLALAKQHPDRIHIISTDCSVEETQFEIIKVLDRLL